MRCLFLFSLFLFIGMGMHYGQSVFESALKSSNGAEKKIDLEFNGYLRAGVYGGSATSRTGSEIKSRYGEACFKLRLGGDIPAKGYSEIRVRKGSEYGTQSDELDFREVYIDLFAGKLDLRIGKQIIVWGRADNINPTNNITPYNNFILSPEEDDRRLGNFLLRGWYNLKNLRLQFIWVPVYESSPLSLHLVPQIPGYSYGKLENPKQKFKNGSFAFKVDLETSSLEGSVSYFNGFNLNPGMNFKKTGGIASVTPEVYRMQVLGADLSTGLLKGVTLRFEGAYRWFNGKSSKVFVPQKDLFFVAGVEKAWGDLNIILQYCGRYVFNFSEPLIEDKNYNEILRNMVLFSQTDQYNHGISVRVEQKLLHETLTLELKGYFGLINKEFMCMPLIKWDVADSLRVSTGARLFYGNSKTSYGMLEDIVNSVFAEVKVSF